MAGYMNPQSFMPDDLVMPGNGNPIFGMGPLSGYNQGLSQAYGIASMNQGLRGGDIANELAQLNLQQKIQNLPLDKAERENKLREQATLQDLYDSGIKKRGMEADINSKIADAEEKQTKTRIQQLAEQGEFYNDLSEEYKKRGNTMFLDNNSQKYWQERARKSMINLPPLSPEVMAAVNAHAQSYMNNREFMQKMLLQKEKYKYEGEISAATNASRERIGAGNNAATITAAAGHDEVKRQLAASADQVIKMTEEGTMDFNEVAVRSALGIKWEKENGDTIMGRLATSGQNLGDVAKIKQQYIDEETAKLRQKNIEKRGRGNVGTSVPWPGESESPTAAPPKTTTEVVPTNAVKTQAEYDKLKSGTLYSVYENGKWVTKRKK